jgi:adenylosuccinate lyase
MRAWEEERDFTALARDDQEIAKHLDAGALDAVFALDSYTRHADVIFDRLQTLTRKEEPIHA